MQRRSRVLQRCSRGWRTCLASSTCSVGFLQSCHQSFIDCSLFVEHLLPNDNEGMLVMTADDCHNLD